MDSVVGNGIVMVSDPVIATVELAPSGMSDHIWLANEVEAAEVSKEGAGRVKLYLLSYDDDNAGTGSEEPWLVDGEIEVKEGAGIPVNHEEVTVGEAVSVTENDDRDTVGVDVSLAGREVADKADVLSSLNQ